MHKYISLTMFKEKSVWVSLNGSYLMEEIIHKMVLFNNNSRVSIIIFSTLKWKNIICKILVLKIFT